MDIQVETPFVLHPQLERITLPDALRPYTVPGKPGPMQNGYFTPLPYKTANDYRNEFLSALTDMAIKKSFDNKIKGIQDGQANDVLERMSQQFNERVAPAYKPDLNNPLLQDPSDALYKQQADYVFNRMAKQFNERGAPVSKTQAAISKANQSAQQVAKSKAAQAKLNNADWVAKYREMSKNATPRVDSISMQSQMAAALRDPVYGQATATGLAAGEGMLNSWIAGINSRARRDENKLDDERWIKQIQALDEDRKLRRDELAEAKKVYVPGEILPDPLIFADEATRKADLEARSKIHTQGRIAKNYVEAAKMAGENNRALIEYLKNREKAPKTLSVKPRTRADVLMDAHETAKGTGDIFSGLKVLDEAGKASKGDFSSRSFNDSPLQIKISQFLEDELGPGTIRYPGLSGYAKDLKASGMDDAARQVLNLIPKLARQGHKTLELIVGDNPRSPAYLRTSQGLFILTPDEEEPLKGVILE